MLSDLVDLCYIVHHNQFKHSLVAGRYNFSGSRINEHPLIQLKTPTDSFSLLAVIISIDVLYQILSSSQHISHMIIHITPSVQSLGLVPSIDGLFLVDSLMIMVYVD